MAKLVFGLNQSLDGYVDHRVMPPEPGLFRHFIEHVRGLSGMVYGVNLGCRDLRPGLALTPTVVICRRSEVPRNSPSVC